MIGHRLVRGLSRAKQEFLAAAQRVEFAAANREAGDLGASGLAVLADLFHFRSPMPESPPSPSITRAQLRDKALLALEEAVETCRHKDPQRSHALRFALFYLWAAAGGDREPFDRFWMMLKDQNPMWRHSLASGALGGIYRALGVERPAAPFRAGVGGEGMSYASQNEVARKLPISSRGGR